MMLSFLYMYLIVAEPTNRRHTHQTIKVPIITMEIIILFLYWMDIVMETYHKWHWKANRKTKYPILFQVKITLIIMMTVDVLIYYPLYYTCPVRIFRIFRTCNLKVIQVFPFCITNLLERLFNLWYQCIGTSSATLSSTSPSSSSSEYLQPN